MLMMIMMFVNYAGIFYSATWSTYHELEAIQCMS